MFRAVEKKEGNMDPRWTCRLRYSQLSYLVSGRRVRSRMTKARAEVIDFGFQHKAAMSA